MIEYLALTLAIPLGFILANLTKDEKKIYSKAPYFPVILWTLTIISIILYTTNKNLAIVTTFIFITTFVWQKA